MFVLMQKESLKEGKIGKQEVIKRKLGCRNGQKRT